MARYRHRLYRYLYRLVREPAAAEDLYQQTWLNAVRRIATYDARSKFDTWLFAIAHNAAIDFLRRSSPESLDETTAAEPASRSDALSLAIASERAAILDTAMAGLPPVYREALTLHFEEGMKLEDPPPRAACSVRWNSCGSVLDAAEERQVRRHIAGCPDCAARLDAFGDLASILISLPAPLPSSCLVARTQAWLAVELAESADRRRSSALAAGAAVLGWMLALALGYVCHLLGGSAAAWVFWSTVPACMAAPVVAGLVRRSRFGA